MRGAARTGGVQLLPYPIMNRRGFLAGILSAGFAPAAIGSGVLMPIRAIAISASPMLSADMLSIVMREAWKMLEVSANINREYERSILCGDGKIVMAAPKRWNCIKLGAA